MPCMSGQSEAAEQVRIAYNNILPPFAETKDGKARGLWSISSKLRPNAPVMALEFVPCPLSRWNLR